MAYNLQNTGANLGFMDFYFQRLWEGLFGWCILRIHAARKRRWCSFFNHKYV